MSQIDKQGFIEFVKLQEGVVLHTLKQQKPFTVRVTKTGVEYTPMSTMVPRPHQAKYMNRVLDHFDVTKSYNTHAYQKITVCSSYTLTLVKCYLDAIENFSR